MSRRLILDGVTVDDSSDCYVIAEIGHNHQGSVDTCRKMIESAKQCGAHAVKLQKRDNRSLFTKAAFDKPYTGDNSYGPTYGAHREALEFGGPEFAELAAFSKDIGITFFATAFDVPSADLLAEFEMPLYKIASADLRNIPLMKHVAKIGKPMIISTGGALMDDIRRAYDAVMAINTQLCILQCTAAYPVEWEEIDLQVIDTFRREFPDVVVGLSAHDNGIAMSVAAYMLGSRVVEKHFTLNRTMRGTDHAFSLEPQGLTKLVRDLKRTRVALGDGVKKVYPSEVAPISKMGKAIVANRNLPAGHLITEADLAFKCPGGGLHPYQIDEVVGKRTLVAVAEDSMIRLADLATAGRTVREAA